MFTWLDITPMAMQERWSLGIGLRENPPTLEEVVNRLIIQVENREVRINQMEIKLNKWVTTHNVLSTKLEQLFGEFEHVVTLNDILKQQFIAWNETRDMMLSFIDIYLQAKMKEEQHKDLFRGRTDRYGGKQLTQKSLYSYFDKLI